MPLIPPFDAGAAGQGSQPRSLPATQLWLSGFKNEENSPPLDPADLSCPVGIRDFTEIWPEPRLGQRIRREVLSPLKAPIWFHSGTGVRTRSLTGRSLSLLCTTEQPLAQQPHRFGQWKSKLKY